MPAPTPRTTPALVMGIIDTQPGVDLTPFIYMANAITTNICAYPNSYFPLALAYTDGYVNSVMELIERWLSAHFYTIYDNQLATAKAGTVAVRYEYKIGLGLKNSMYGQQAMFLDTNGGLASLSNLNATQRAIRVGMAWLGTKHRWPGPVAGWPDITIES